jgi:hypothetical protein
VSLAEGRIQVLEPRLARITVNVVEPVNDLVVTVNGTPLGEAGWGTPVPVDAGKVELRAEAPDRTTYTSALQVKDTQNLTLEIPALLPVGEGSPATDASAPDKGSAPDNTVVYTTGGLGLAAVGLGSYFGVRALRENHRADQDCEKYCSTDEGTIADENAVFAGWISTASIGAGLVALGLAAYYYESPAPARDTAARPLRWQLIPSVGPAQVGLDASWHY